MKIAMIRVDRRLKAEGFQARIVLQIHDELLVEAPREETSRVKVALEVEAKTGDSWFAAK